jgi:hypothetical protein
VRRPKDDSAKTTSPPSRFARGERDWEVSTAEKSHTTIPGNFKISENEGPLPPNRVFFTSNYYRGGVGPEVFVGVSVTAAIEQTNFAVSEPFNVNGSGVMGGIFGGVLLPVPNTNILMGPRVGWEGGNINGSKEAIPFTYFVTTNSMFFQEALVKVPFRSPFEFYSDNANHLSLNDISPYLDPYITASAGIAEVHEVVKGTSGAFSVTSSVFSPAITFTVGGGVPIARELFGFEKIFLGGNADIVVQWRGTLATGTVNIPGAVPQAYFINAIEGGLVIHN